MFLSRKQRSEKVKRKRTFCSPKALPPPLERPGQVEREHCSFEALDSLLSSIHTLLRHALSRADAETERRGRRAPSSGIDPRIRVTFTSRRPMRRRGTPGLSWNTFAARACMQRNSLGGTVPRAPSGTVPAWNNQSAGNTLLEVWSERKIRAASKHRERKKRSLSDTASPLLFDVLLLL